MLNNKKFKNNNIVIMNFTGVYENQEFYQDLGAVWLELGDIQGTNCYCDEEAEAAIKERISLMEPSGIHFLDSGNYHYVSKIWLDKIEEEFELLVFDHHTDMQMPMFGNILSCGGWIQAALDTNTRLKRVYLAGPPSMEAEADRERVVGINEEELKTPGCISRHLKNSELPLPDPLLCNHQLGPGRGAAGGRVGLHKGGGILPQYNRCRCMWGEYG